MPSFTSISSLNSGLASVYRNALNIGTQSTQTTFDNKTLRGSGLQKMHKHGYYGQNYYYNSTLPNVGITLIENTNNCGMRIKPEVLNSKLKNLQNTLSNKSYHTTGRINEKYYGFQPKNPKDKLPQQPFGLAPKTKVKRLNKGHLKTTSSDYGNFKRQFQPHQSINFTKTSHRKENQQIFR